MILDIAISGTGNWRFTMKRVRSGSNYREFMLTMTGLDASHVNVNRQEVKELVASGFCSALNNANTKCTYSSCLLRVKSVNSGARFHWTPTLPTQVL